MKIETKYNIGDRVWIVYENKIRDSHGGSILTGEVSIFDTQIDSITIMEDGFVYGCDDGAYTELCEEDVILYEETDKLVAKIQELMAQIHEREEKENE